MVGTWIIWRKAHASEVALLTVGAGGFFVVLAGVWLWVALQNGLLHDTVPYGFTLLAAGVILVVVGVFWYTRAKREESRVHPESVL
jgi:ribose/xylose/arabinose/galactoside ABC-type transport system permease subunit